MNKPFEVVDLGPAPVSAPDYDNYVCPDYQCSPADYVCCGTGTKIINR